MESVSNQEHRLASWKTTLEWLALLVTLVLPALGFIGAIAWKAVGESLASAYIQSVVASNISTAEHSIEDINFRLKGIEGFEKSVKDSFSKDVSSAYFMSKTYSVGKDDSEQDTLQGFFYASNNDKITLSIFTTEHHPDLYVSINGSAQLSLRDIAAKQQKNTWTDVDIGQVISDTPLTDAQYIDLPNNVNLISITPSPKRMKSGYTFDLYALVTVRHAK